MASAWSNQTTFGSLGEGASQFDRPYGVTLSADALTLWVADTRNGRIAVWTRPDTTSANWVNVTSFGDSHQFILPRSVALSPDELTMWVADDANNRVSSWSRPSTSSHEWMNQTTFGRRGDGAS